MTMIGLQNAGKTSLLRVLAVSLGRVSCPSDPTQLTVRYRVASLRSSARHVVATVIHGTDRPPAPSRPWGST